MVFRGEVAWSGRQSKHGGFCARIVRRIDCAWHLCRMRQSLDLASSYRMSTMSKICFPLEGGGVGMGSAVFHPTVSLMVIFLAQLLMHATLPLNSDFISLCADTLTSVPRWGRRGLSHIARRLCARHRADNDGIDPYPFCCSYLPSFSQCPPFLQSSSHGSN